MQSSKHKDFCMLNGQKFRNLLRNGKDKEVNNEGDNQRTNNKKDALIPNMSIITEKKASKHI